ncbi:hypothetical protein FRB97_003143, partial [Tulasnella sp. 331]
HLDLISFTFQATHEFASSLSKLNQVNFDTHVRSLRMVGTPPDHSDPVCAIWLLGMFSETNGIDHLEVMLGDYQPDLERSVALYCYVTSTIGHGCSHSHSLTLHSFSLPPWDDWTENNFENELSCLDELHLRHCNIHTPQLLWHWKLPKLQTLIIDCTPQATVSVDVSLKRALRRTSGWPPLPSVRHVVLNNIHIHLDLQLLLSVVPNATTLALTAPLGEYTDLTSLSDQPLPYPTDDRLTSLTWLTILSTTPDMYKLRTFVEAKLPALQIVELNERVPMGSTDDLELLKDRVEVCFISEYDMEFERVLGRMKHRDSSREGLLV